MTSEDLFERFAQAFEAAGGELLFPKDGLALKEALETMIQKEEVTSYGLSWRAPKARVIDAILKDLGVERSRDYSSVDLGITGAQGAGAATGTLAFAFWKGRDHLLTSLPRIHLGVLRRRDIFPHISQAVMPPLKSVEPPPPYLSLVTGPSKTGDIELTHVTGVHGPEKLYLLVV